MSAHAPYTNMGFIANSVLVDQLWPRTMVEDILPPTPEEEKQWKLPEWDSCSETKFLEYESEEGEESEEEDRVLFLDSPEPEIKFSPLKQEAPLPEVVEEKSPKVLEKPKVRVCMLQ